MKNEYFLIRKDLEFLWFRFFETNGVLLEKRCQAVFGSKQVCVFVCTVRFVFLQAMSSVSEAGTEACKILRVHDSAPSKMVFVDVESPSPRIHTSASTKGYVLQWDEVLDCICDELIHIQALRPVCRECVTNATAELLCHLAFHEDAELMLDPHSDRTLPIWSRCFAYY